MHTKTLQKLALALTFWLALHLSSLQAQTFTAPLKASTTGTHPVDFEFRANGVMIAKGDFGIGSLLTADQGDGTRLLWFPSLGAFRAGNIDTGLSLGSGPWDSGNIGVGSVAFGGNTTASGDYSFAAGYNTVAWQDYATALGYNSSAGGYYSLAVGYYASAQGEGSVAFGELTTCYSAYSMAIGYATGAHGISSVATGTHTDAFGDNSTASGAYTHADADFSFVTGNNNVGGPDALFEVGNGEGSSTPTDAIVVYKNGNVTAQGSIRCSPGGDLSMGSFTAGTHP